MWYVVVAVVSATFGFLLCSLLVCGRREDECTEAREYYESRQHEMCARCRELDEERNEIAGEDVR